MAKDIREIIKNFIPTGKEFNSPYVKKLWKSTGKEFNSPYVKKLDRQKGSI